MPSTLLQRVASGDAAAVKECLDGFGSLVWSLARRMAPRDEVDDAVQEIFIAIWENAHRYDPGVASESTFIAMIARRKLIDRIRKQNRQPHFDALSEDAPPSAAARVNGLEMADEVQQVATAVDQLHPDQQKVLKLSIHHGWTYEQIAEVTSLPLGTVKSHARRGLMRAREILKQGTSGAVGLV